MIQKHILLTGSNGFFGSIIRRRIGEDQIVTMDLQKADINCNLSKGVPTIPVQGITKVIHCAGKAHSIPKTEAEKQVFFDVNTNGTAHLLQALEEHTATLKQLIFISTVAVYGLIEGDNIKEEQPLKPNTPYGESKVEAEKLVIDWCKSHQVNYLILRLPLLVGANVPGNLKAMKEAISNGRYPKITGNTSRKSMVIADDVAELMKSWTTPSGIFHVTDSHHPLFKEVEQAIEHRVNKKIRIAIPLFVLKIMASIGDVIEGVTKKEFPISSLRLKKLTSTLTFDDSKARQELNWTSQSALQFIKEQL